jgi:hypothetical protein
MRKAIISILGGAAILGAPWLLLLAPTPLSEDVSVAVAYLLIFAVVSWARFEWPEWADAATWVYCLAGILAIAVAFFAGSLPLSLIALVAALIGYRLSYLEKWSGLILASVGAVYVGAAQLVPIDQWPRLGYALVLMVAGTLIFGFGQILATKEEEEERGLQLRQAGMVGPFLGSLIGLAAGDQSQVTIMALAVGGGLLFAEGYIEFSQATEEIAGGIIIAAYEWLLVSSGATIIFAYTLPWVIYFAYLAHMRKPDSLGHDVMVGLALAVLTIPVAIVALGSGGDIYGLGLVLAGLVISIVGSVQLSPLVTWWGAGTVLIEGAYILPKYLAPNTELPFIAGAIGLVIFAIAVMVHMNREEAEED